MRRLSRFALALRLTLGSTLAFVGCGGDADDGTTDSADITICKKSDLRLADRTQGHTPILGASNLEVVANLPYPPGNVAVANDGRVFLSFFPDSNRGDAKVAELVDGKVVAFPSKAFQDKLDTVLGVHVDHQNRLWMLDFGTHGIHPAKIWAIDLATRATAFQYTFPRSVAPIGSMMNDFAVAPDGKTVYLTDTSHVKGKQGLVVLDLSGSKPVARRRLSEHRSVESGKHAVFVGGKKVTTAGIVCLEHGVDGLALDATGAFLYYSSLNSGELWRIKTSNLRSTTLSDEALGKKAQKVADVTMTDGMIADAEGNVYLTDMEHSAVVRVSTSGKLDVVLKDKRLRWPDGFAWAPDGSLYLSASALAQTIPIAIKTDASIAKFAPYQLFRFHPQDACAADEACTGKPGQ